MAWKKIHAHVFRPPRNPMLFSLAVGAGYQATCMALMTMLVCFFTGTQSFLGNYMLFFPMFGGVNGYMSATTYAFYSGSRWGLFSFFAGTVFPTVMFMMQ